MMLVAICLGYVSGCGQGNDNETPVATASALPTATATPVVTASVPATPSTTPTVVPLVAEGVYDVTIGRGGGSVDSVGIVSLTDGNAFVSLSLGADTSVAFGGPVIGSGTMTGQGIVTVADELFQDTGEAVFSDASGVHMVTGSVVAPSFVGSDHPITFTMRRPADADASGFSGTYRFALAPSPSACTCPSTVDLTLTIGISGMGMAAAATEHSGDGTSLASLPGVFVSLSPQGKVRITGSYEPVAMPPFSGPLALIGTVHGSGTLVTASGDTFFGDPLTPAIRIGTWNAERN
jgi:hypothetical protein